MPALAAAGHEVTALARTPERAAALRTQGATPVSVSLFDQAGLTKVLAAQQAVVNLATAIPPMSRFLLRRSWAANDRLRTQGSATLVDAALAAGVDRLVQESVSMLYAEGGANWVDEDSPVDRFPMAEGNLAAEANTARFTVSGGTGVVLRFGWFYGPGATHSEQILALARHHIGTVLGAADGYLSSIHVLDAAEAVVAALDAPAGVLNVVDDRPLTKRDYVSAVATAAGTSLWLRAPGRAKLLLGGRLTSLTRSLRVSNARLRQSTGWSPRYPSARQGWTATAAALGRRAGT